MNFEVTVTDGSQLYRPASSRGAPSAGDLTTENPAQLAVAVGSNCWSRRVRRRQVKEVEVRGWDATTKKAPCPPAGQDRDHRQRPRLVELAGSPGPQPVAVDAADDGQGGDTAQALAERVAAAFTEMEGQARGDPKLKAGAAITIDLLGAPFDGKYVITSARHTYDSVDGYTTWFTVSGRQERSLLGLTGASGGGAPGRVPGVVPAIDDVDDPDQQGRVRFP